MKLNKKIGSTSEIWQVFIRDSSSTTGGGLTGLVFNTASLTAYYHRDTDTSATSIALVTMTSGTFTSSGFKEIDATNMPGWYQFCPPNAALASGAKSCGFHLKGAANMAPLPIEVQLTGVDMDDTVRGGMTALPNAAAEAAGGLYTRGTGAGQIAQSNNGRTDSDVKSIANGVIAAATFAANALDAVWSTTIRLLTAGTNIALAKGTGVTGFTDLDAAAVRTAVGLGSANLDTQLSAIKTDVDAIPTVTALTAAGVRSAVGLASANLDTQLGAIKTDVDAIPTVTALTAAGVRSAVGLATANLDTQLGAIKTDVDAIPTVTALTAAGVRTAVGLATANLDTQLGAIKTDVDAIPDATEIENAVWDVVLADHLDSGSTGEALDGAGGGGSAPTVSDIVAGILDETIAGHNTSGTVGKAIIDIGAKTTNLPSDPADASDIASSFSTVNSKLDAIDDYVDTEVAAIKAKTDNLPATPASQGDVTSVGSDVTAIKAKTDNLPTSPAASSYKKNTAISGFTFQMFDDSAGDPATGLTVVVKVSKDGGALTTSSNSAAEISLGWYTIDLTSGEMNAKTVALNFTAAGAKSYGVVLPTEG